MNINDCYEGGKYLRAADLQGRAVDVTIDDIRLEQIADDEKEKPVVYFKNKESGLVLNKTNARHLADMYGPETDAWIGKEIKLVSMKVNFRNEMVDAIRIAHATADEDVPF